MILFFRQKSPGNFLLLLLFSFALKLPLFLHPQQATALETDEDIYHWLVAFLNNTASPAFYASLVAYLFLYAQALMVNYLVNHYRMLNKKNYLPAMAYIVITSLLPEWTFLSSPLVANTFIIWIFILLYKLYNVDAARGTIFNIGLLLGLSSYIYFPSAVFLVCVLLGIIILKPFRLNEIILLMMGCLVPYYFSGAYLFITDQLSFNSFFPHVSVRVPTVKSNIYLAISTLLLSLPFLIGGYFVQGHLHKMLIQVRKNWSILLLYLLLAFFVPFINSYTSFSNWVLVAVPFACFHAAVYFFSNNKWIPNIFFFLTLAFIFYQQYATTLWQ